MGYQVPSVNQCYDFSCVIGQLQAWCCSHAPLVQSVYDECKGTSLSEQVAYLFGVVRDVVKAQQCVDENFKTLYDFVKDFFENLDLQEEVNNKLEEMYQDGSLADLINNDLVKGIGFVKISMYETLQEAVDFAKEKGLPILIDVDKTISETVVLNDIELVSYNNSTLTINLSTIPQFLRLGNNCTLKGIHFKLNEYIQNVTQAIVLVTGHNNHITDCIFESPVSAFLLDLLNTAQYNVIESCTFINGRYQINYSGSHYCKVLNCEFYTVGDNSFETCGIKTQHDNWYLGDDNYYTFKPNTGANDPDRIEGDNLIIYGCSFHDLTENGLDGFTGIYKMVIDSCSFNRISNQSLELKSLWQTPEEGSSTSNKNRYCRDIKIVNCFFNSTANAYEIYLVAENTISSPDFVHQKNIVIKNNTFTSNLGILLKQTDNVEISDNIFTVRNGDLNSTFTQITGCKNISVHDNIMDFSNNNVTNNICNLVNDDTQNELILYKNNIIKEKGTTGVRGIQTNNRVDIDGNVFELITYACMVISGMVKAKGNEFNQCTNGIFFNNVAIGFVTGCQFISCTACVNANNKALTYLGIVGCISDSNISSGIGSVLQSGINYNERYIIS